MAKQNARSTWRKGDSGVRGVGGWVVRLFIVPSLQRNDDGGIGVLAKQEKKRKDEARKTALLPMHWSRREDVVILKLRP